MQFDKDSLSIRLLTFLRPSVHMLACILHSFLLYLISSLPIALFFLFFYSSSFAFYHCVIFFLLAFLPSVHRSLFLVSLLPPVFILFFRLFEFLSFFLPPSLLPSSILASFLSFSLFSLLYFMAPALGFVSLTVTIASSIPS